MRAARLFPKVIHNHAKKPFKNAHFLRNFGRFFCTFLHYILYNVIAFLVVLCYTLYTGKLEHLYAIMRVKIVLSFMAPRVFFLPLTLCRAGGFFIPHHKLPCDSIPNGNSWNFPAYSKGSNRERSPANAPLHLYYCYNIWLFPVHYAMASYHVTSAPATSPPLDTRRGRESPSAMSEAKRRLWRAER